VSDDARERPIIFSAPMVRAILDGRKTQTRRIVRDADRIELHDGGRPHSLHGRNCPSFCEWACGAIFFDERGEALEHDNRPTTRTPYGGPGSKLWVRETFAYSIKDPESFEEGFSPETHDAVYRATDEGGEWERYENGERAGKTAPTWRPSIHMPRWASRIMLVVESVRVERLQEITEEDARAEGVEAHLMRDIGSYPEWMRPNMRSVGGHQSAFRELWDSINGKRASWASSPWVWVVSFRRVTS
jgi:hypothetical protein